MKLIFKFYEKEGALLAECQTTGKKELLMSAGEKKRRAFETLFSLTKYGIEIKAEILKSINNALPGDTITVDLDQWK